MSVDDEVDVVIIGAGVAGLTAGYQLWKKDHSIRVVVLEAKDRVGGRTLTVKIPAAKGEDDFDLGGQWVGSCQPHITSLLEELGIERYKQFTTGAKCMQLGQNNQIRYYKNGLPGLSFLSLIDLFFFSSKVEKMCLMVPVDNPSDCPHAEEWDGMTGETFARKHLWTQGARDAIDSALTCIFGRLPKDMSFLYFLHYCHAAGGLQAVIESEENSGQEYKIKGGAQQVSHKLVEKIGPKNVLLGQPVKNITQGSEAVRVETMGGRRFRCKRVIVATPPNMAGNIQYEPALPAAKSEIYQHMPVGYLIKVIVTYKKAFWRDAGLSGEVVTNGGKSIVAGCTSGPLCVVFDATTINQNPALVSFIGAKQGIEWSKEPFEVRKKAVLNNLAECLGAEAMDCIFYREKNWAEEPYNGGCPVSTVMPGAMTCFASGLREPFQRVHFAGTESATVWCGFINGAVQSGIRAANEVLYHLRPQTLTAEDIKITAYAPKCPKTTPNSQRKRSLIKWTLGLGTLVVVVYAVKKSLLNSSN